MRIFIPGRDAPPAEGLGGKADNLLRLRGMNVPVPPWFAVLPEADCPEIGELAAAVRECGMAGERFAVRSSARGEDGAEHSFAGQFETCLDIVPGMIPAAVERVRASAKSERAAAYCAGVNAAGVPAMAVIVQEMVDAACSGVAFGVDLETGSRRGVTVAACRGTGEALVSGEVSGDVYYVNGGRITHKISGETPVLSDATVLDVAAAAAEISRRYGRPQDVEWSCDRAGKLWMLQARPITTLASLPPSDELAVIWDNSNIVESYPGVTTPLTFSFIRGVYSEVYRQFCLMMGVEPEVIARNSGAFEMLGLIGGRVYYNLLNWYKLLMMLPGYEINAPFMEQMMGVKEKLPEPPSIVRSGRNKYLQLVFAARKLLGAFWGIDRSVKKFHADFDRLVSPLEHSDLAGMPPLELIVRYRRLEAELLPAWRTPLANDFFAMIFYGLLRKLLVKYRIDANATLQNALLTGGGDMISTEPVRRLRELANLAADTPELAAALNSGDSFSGYLQFERALQSYVDKFGDRCIGELKLETVTYREDAAPLLDIVRCYVAKGRVDFEAASRREQELRAAAERVAAAKLRRHPLRSLIFSLVLRNTRKFVRNRENLRFERTRLFATVRRIFLELGTFLTREGVLSVPRDVFYLTRDEIFDFVEGTSVQRNLAALVAMRKIEYAGYESTDPAERFTTFGAVNCANLFKGKPRPPSAPGGDVLTGIGCSPGVVRARVRVVDDPRDTYGLAGAILVTVRTDPGWATLFPVCAGVLVERGSILSHAAIVTRELGIPAVVGINNLTAILRDGEMVEMDGSAGTVRKVEATP